MAEPSYTITSGSSFVAGLQILNIPWQLLRRPLDELWFKNVSRSPIYEIHMGSLDWSFTASVVLANAIPARFFNE